MRKENIMEKVHAFYESMTWMNDCYAINIGHEDARVYPYKLREAKRRALADHHIRPCDVIWHDMEKLLKGESA